jgi:hypothetical protein
MIHKCFSHLKDTAEHSFKVCYLTIHEDYVPEGVSQRRPGLHTESPGSVPLFPEEFNITAAEFKQRWHPWGFGIGPTRWEMEGGIFMASNIADSCRVWDCVMKDHGVIAIDSLGGLEHLRGALNKGPKDRVGIVVEPNQMLWITDRTPHESLPLKKGEFRQYFRFVTSQVGIWYEDHSTKNDCGVVPPETVRIVKGSKFDSVHQSKEESHLALPSIPALSSSSSIQSAKTV